MRIAHSRGTVGGMEAIVTRLLAVKGRRPGAKRDSLNDFSTLVAA